MNISLPLGRSLKCALWLLVLGLAGFTAVGPRLSPARAEAAPAASSALPEVIAVRLGVNQDNTRFVIETNARLTYTVSQLADPYRLVIDINQVDWKNNSSGEGPGKGIVDKYRFGLFTPGTSRLVLDLKKPADVVHSFIIPPRGGSAYRLVIDLREVSRDDFLKLVKAPPTPSGTSAENNSPAGPQNIPVNIPVNVPAESAKAAAKPAAGTHAAGTHIAKKIIVIDPGHGGIDPGSPSVIGVPEKTLTLAAAKSVCDALNATGRYRAYLTRDSDIFIPLRERFEIARRKKANLFISFHADSHPNKAIRGATVYTLSERASDREAAALAAKENKADLIAGINLGGETPEVSTILIDLAQRETMNYSSHFANLLVADFKNQILLGQNSHRFAGFVVLKAPDIPSVLVEMGYLSNLKDATLLASPAHRKVFSEAVVKAVDDYFTQVVTR